MCDVANTAPLERRKALTFFYKHIAPLERKTKHANSDVGVYLVSQTYA